MYYRLECTQHRMYTDVHDTMFDRKASSANFFIQTIQLKCADTGNFLFLFLSYVDDNANYTIIILYGIRALFLIYDR
jgi:hypothetical protein